MTKSRASKLCSLSAVAVAACAGAAPPSAAVPEGGAVRRPVMVEAAPSLPAPAVRAQARGIVALVQPAAHDPAVEATLAVVDAWKSGSLAALVALLSRDAGPIADPALGRTALIDGWRQRLRAHEYARLRGLEVVRRDRIARWDWDDLAVAGAPSRPAAMRKGDVYVRAPVEAAGQGGEALFGDVLVLLLRPEADGLAVVGYGEESL